MKYILTFFAVLFVFGIVSANYFYFVGADNRGTFGDMFGAANALFSGLAFVGLVFAILQQREELKIAKEDARETKKILDKQQDHIDLQNKQTQKQMFENTFFQMLRMYNEISESVDLYTGSGTSAKGKDFFKNRYRNLISILSKNYTIRNHKDEFEDNYENFYKNNKGDLSHYFRVMYNLIKFVDQSNIEYKKFYTNILRANLSDYEVGLLFYNGLSKYGAEFKPLIEKYALLKHHSVLTREQDEELKALYHPSAFGEPLEDNNP
jgi:mannitol-specific phosphotransferase system IIBC component